MKMAAVLTSHVMEGVCQLPGVATLDWCDRAATALCKLHHPSWVGMVVGRLDARGVLTNVEVTGAAASAPVAGSPPATHPARTVDLHRVRQTYREGEPLGWLPGAWQEGIWFVGSAAAAGLLARKNESGLARRWNEVDPAEVLLGAVQVPGAPGRLLLVELVSHDPGLREESRVPAVLAAVLPLLQRKVVNALGSAPADKSSWLTPREEIVLWQLVAGKKVPQIAQELHRSVYTVHDHVKSLHRKLGASNRGQLVARALGHIGPLAASALAESTAEPKPAKPGATTRPASRPGGV